MTTIVSGLPQIQASRSPLVGADSDGGQSRPTPVVFQQGPIVEIVQGFTRAARKGTWMREVSLLFRLRNQRAPFVADH
jgi:hypothetical protein